MKCMPEKFNNRLTVLHREDSFSMLIHFFQNGFTGKVGDDWITDLPKIKGIEVYADDKKAQAVFMNIKYQNTSTS